MVYIANIQTTYNNNNNKSNQTKVATVRLLSKSKLVKSKTLIKRYHINYHRQHSIGEYIITTSSFSISLY